MKQIVSLFITVTLILITVFCLSGCSSEDGAASSGTSSVAVHNHDHDNDDSPPNYLGNGKTTIYFVVEIDTHDDSPYKYEIHTDKDNLGDALREFNMITGDQTEYGMFVKAVTEFELDPDKDGMFWALYIDGEQALTGVDQTKLTAGETYTLKAEAIQ